MTLRRFFSLLLLAVLVVVAAVALERSRHHERRAEAGRAVLPALRAELNAVQRLKLIGAGEHTLVTVENRDGRWRVAEREGFPADSARVRQLLIALADLKVHEVKTADPSRYAVLGVEDTTAPEAKSVRVELDGPAPALALVVGRHAPGDAMFVRVPGQAAALEAGPAFALDKEPREWLARVVLDVAPERVHDIAEQGPGATWHAQREKPGAALLLADAPKGSAAPAEAILSAVGGALRGLEAEDVRRATPSDGASMTRAVYRTFDGLRIELRGRREAEERWVSVEAQIDAEAGAQPSDAARAEAARYQELTRSFEFRLSAYRYDDLFMARDRLLKR
jgi:hypothetical protein